VTIYFHVALSPGRHIRQKSFYQPICRTKEQKTRLQCLARAMPKSVMPSAAKNGEVLRRKSGRI